MKQHRAAEPEAIREARATRQAKDAAELKGDFTRRQNALEASLKREYAKPRAALSGEIARTEERIGKPGFFRAIARKITGAEKCDHRLLAQLRESLGAIEADMERRGLIFAGIDDQLQKPLDGDLHGLRRILENLLGNAIKFTPEGGRVGIRLKAAGDVFGFLGRYDRQVSVIREGRERVFLGWLTPGWNAFSNLPIYLSRFLPKKRFAMTTTTNGSNRAMVPSGSSRPAAAKA